MNRDALVAAVAKATNRPREDAEQLLAAILEHIVEALCRGDDVTLVGFGQFRVDLWRGRRSVNPRKPTQTLEIPSAKVVKFRAGKNLKDAVRRS